MNNRTGTFLKAVQRGFLLILFLIIVLSTNALAGTFMFDPGTHQTICYDVAGKEISCPTAGDPMTQTVSFPGDPSPNADGKNGRPFMFVPATHKIIYNGSPDSIITTPPGSVTQVVNYTVDPSIYIDLMVTDDAGITFMHVPATRQTACYDRSGNAITCPPGVESLWHKPEAVPVH